MLYISSRFSPQPETNIELSESGLLFLTELFKKYDKVFVIVMTSCVYSCLSLFRMVISLYHPLNKKLVIFVILMANLMDLSVI